MASKSLDTALLDLVGVGETVRFIGAGFSIDGNLDSESRRDRPALKDQLQAKFAVTLANAPFDPLICRRSV